MQRTREFPRVPIKWLKVQEAFDDEIVAYGEVQGYAFNEEDVRSIRRQWEGTGYTVAHAVQSYIDQHRGE